MGRYFPFTTLFACCLVACSGEDGGAADPEGSPYPAPEPDDCIQSVEPGHQTLTCEGLSFELGVPPVCLEQACGLIFDVHGFGMNAVLEQDHTKLRDRGNAEGYIVVQPSAPGALLQASWSESHDTSILAIMQRVQRVWHVDAKRIHFGGYSQGAFMTWRFVCAHADIIASAAPIAGGQGCSGTGPQTPAREVPVFYTHGRTDGLVPFATATAQRDGWTANLAFAQTEVISEAADHKWTRYQNANGTVFEFAEHAWECAFSLGTRPLAGHCFPGSELFLGCGATNAFNYGQAVIEFYKNHPMP
jgi:poly(3-hydroxybutyrate) depolymerase